MVEFLKSLTSTLISLIKFKSTNPDKTNMFSVIFNATSLINYLYSILSNVLVLDMKLALMKCAKRMSQLDSAEVFVVFCRQKMEVQYQWLNGKQNAKILNLHKELNLWIQVI